MKEQAKKLINGQTAFIVWPGLGIKDIYNGEYNFNEPFEVVEVKICSRSPDKEMDKDWTFLPHYHYKVCFTCKEDRDRLIPTQGESVDWDWAFEYEEASIGETPEEAIKNACIEIEPMVLGYANMLDRLRDLRL